MAGTEGAQRDLLDVLARYRGPIPTGFVAGGLQTKTGSSHFVTDFLAVGYSASAGSWLASPAVQRETKAAVARSGSSFGLRCVATGERSG